MNPAAQSRVSALPLSQREQQVVELLLQDLSDKDIGNRLGLATNTVCFYMRNIRAKLRVKSRVGIALIGTGYLSFGVKTNA
jgi:DNA-binding CsgD family transcriptional regulator